MKKITFLLILMLWVVTSTAQADISSGSFYGLQYGKIATEMFVPDQTAAPSFARKIKPNLDTFVFRVGHYFTNYLAAEVHLGSSLSNEDTLGTSSQKIKNLAGFFVRGNFPLHAQNANIYILLGGTRAEAVSKEPPNTLLPTGKLTATDTQGSYALGLELYATPTTAFNIEYARYFLGGDTDPSIGGFSIGFISHFSLPRLFK